MKVVKEAFLSLKKYKFMTLATIMVLTFNLLMLSIFGVLMYNLNSFLDEIKNSVEITVFLKDGIKKEVADGISVKIKLKTEVADAIFVSREDAIKELGESEDFRGYLNNFKINPLPDSIRVILNKEFKNDSVKMKETAEFCKQLDGVAEAYYQKEEVDKFFSLADVIRKIIIWLSMILFLGSVVIISNTIRISILARKEDLKKMRSEGVSWSGLKSIFIIESILQGLAGGVLAVLVLFVLERAALEKLNILWSGKWHSINIFAALIIIFTGIFLGFVGALFFRIKSYMEK